MTRRLLATLLVLALATGCKKTAPAAADAGASVAAEPTTFAIDLSKSATSGEPAPTLTITFAKDGSLTLDGKAVTEDQLRALIRTRAKDPELSAVLQIDGDVPHKDVIRLVDLVKQSGISKIVLGVRPPHP
jgi:biopolymer transport protein ExbD